VRSSRGKTNPVTVLSILGLIVAAWYGFYMVPLFLDNLEAQEACAQAVNIAAGEGEAVAKAAIQHRLNEIHGGNPPVGWHYVIDEETGVESEQNGLGVLADNIEVTINEQAKTIDVTMQYDRVVQLKPLDKRTTTHFSIHKSGKTR
jgi:hypothetical protein